MGAKQVIAAHPEINVLINNAGVLQLKNMTRTEEDLENMTDELDINVKGPIRVTSAFMDTLVKNKGTIINISSALGFVPNMAMPIYCASKAAIHSYTISLRQQLEGKVEVIEVAPPLVKTDLINMKGAGMPVDEFTKATIDEIAAGKPLITVGLASKFRFMSRLAPEYIQNQLKQKAAKLLPS